MPYLKEEGKEKFKELANVIAWGPDIQTPGELNYLFTLLAKKYISIEKNYQRLNDVDGAFSCAAKEFYRRVTAPYEDLKIAENGDVY